MAGDGSNTITQPKQQQQQQQKRRKPRLRTEIITRRIPHSVTTGATETPNDGGRRRSRRERCF